MTMPSLARKDIERLVDHVKPQGVTVTRTKKGYLMRLPDGTSTTVHFTTSDVHAGEKVKATLKRAGVTWPTDPGAYRINSKPSKETIQRGLAAWRAMGSPTVVRSSELSLAMGYEEGQRNLSVRRWLTWAGFDLVGQTRGARWVLYEPRPELGPVEAVTTPDNVTVLRAVERPAEPDAPEEPQEPAEAPQEAPAAPEPQPEPDEAPTEATPAAVVDSWVVPGAEDTPAAPPSMVADLGTAWATWEDLPGDWTVDQLRLMLLAFGLDAELRVWRTR